MDFTVISSDEMDFVPRGRKSTVAPELVKAIAGLKGKQALRLDSLRASERKDKARVSAQIRTAAKQAKQDVIIRWTRTGIPQVALKG